MANEQNGSPRSKLKAFIADQQHVAETSIKMTARKKAKETIMVAQSIDKLIFG